MSFDLIEVPDGFKTNLVLIVAPYVDPKFMRKIAQELLPNRLCLVVDEGIRKEDLDLIRNACLQKNTDLEIRLGQAKALVHMKAFYFEFQREEPPRVRRRRLIFGSANATDAGFSGKRNAELIADVDLAIGEDSELTDYFEEILASFNSDLDGVKIEDKSIVLSKQPTLFLPAFKCVLPDQSPTGFDTWLQRGVLAAQYRNAPQFLTVSIPLKKSLPQDLVAKIFSDQQFSEKTSRNTVRFGYLNDTDALPVDDEIKPLWKSQFAVWTHLGDWVSEQCYRENSTVMKSATSEIRRRRIDELQANAENDSWREMKRNDFLSALWKVWSALVASEIPPQDYLLANIEQNGLDFLGYAERFDKKLEQDFLLSCDREFKDRYVNGYDFPDVPRFRQDTAAWDKFVRSWCDSLLVESVKNKSKSLVVQRVAQELKVNRVLLEDLTDKKLADFLRKYWNKPSSDDGYTVGDRIMSYWDVTGSY